MYFSLYYFGTVKQNLKEIRNLGLKLTAKIVLNPKLIVSKHLGPFEALKLILSLFSFPSPLTLLLRTSHCTPLLWIFRRLRYPTLNSRRSAQLQRDSVLRTVSIRFIQPFTIVFWSFSGNYFLWHRGICVLYELVNDERSVLKYYSVLLLDRLISQWDGADDIEQCIECYS